MHHSHLGWCDVKIQLSTGFGEIFKTHNETFSHDHDSGDGNSRHRHVARHTHHSAALSHGAACPKHLCRESLPKSCPEAVVNAERAKAQKARDLIASLEQSLAAMQAL